MQYTTDKKLVDTNALQHYKEKSDELLSQKVDTSTFNTEMAKKANAADVGDVSALTGKLEQKVDKVEGSSLITTEKLEQIDTNKTDIDTLKSQVQTLETQNEGIDSFLEEYV